MYVILWYVVSHIAVTLFTLMIGNNWHIIMVSTILRYLPVLHVLLKARHLLKYTCSYMYMLVALSFHSSDANL